MTAGVLAWRMLRRDWRAGELRVLVLAVVVAVASLTSVAAFTDRVHLALANQANELLGGDLVLNADHEPPRRYLRTAAERGLGVAEAVMFPSMVLAGEQSQLVALKAVTAAYPLRGELRIASELFGPDTAAPHGPDAGTVWAESRLLTTLGISVGDAVTVGASQLRVTAVLTNEPARAAGGVFNIAPRLLMHVDDVAATGLVQPASRVSYQLLFAGTAGQIDAWRQWLEREVAAGEALQGVDDARPEVRSALERAQRFLGLAAMVSVVLAGVAVAMATRRYVQRHLDHCAVMRCFGATQRTILRIYILQMVLLALAGGIVGVAVGYVAQWGLVVTLGPLTGADLPPASLLPLANGLFIAMVVLLGFGVPPLLQIKQVPTLRVLRRDLGIPQRGSVMVFVFGLTVLAGLTVMQAGDVKLAVYTLLGVAATLLVLGALAAGLVWALRGIRSQVGVAWRFGLANISRRAGSSVVQVAGFGLGIMALLLLAMIRGDLLSDWRERLPDETPNRFLINIQPDQVADVRDFLVDEGMVNPLLYPMVRGRLVAINGRGINADDYEGDEHAQALLDREFNLSWSADLHDGNEVVAGQWWQPADRERAVLSVEESIAEHLNVGLGDTLTYHVAGRSFQARVANIRTVDWDTFRPNFYVLSPPGLLDDYPASYITSFYLPSAQHGVLNRLIQRFPNVTVLDVAAIMQQVRRIIERVTLAVEFVFLFTVIAGLVVMYASIQATLDERIQETAVLRTLGARRDQLLYGLIAEFAGLGVLAGLVAAVSASAIAWALAHNVFNLTFTPALDVVVAGVLFGAVGIGIAGILSTRFILNQPPLQTLRGL